MKLEVKAINLLAKITMGQSPTGDTYNRNGTGVPLLNGPTEFGEYYPDCTQYTTDSKRESHEGDLIFCVRGSTTGRMNISDKAYSLGRGVCAISGFNHHLTSYIKYALDLYLPALLQLSGGGTFPNLTGKDIGSFEIPFNPKTYQPIQLILRAYDDLIENNLRRIKLLEDAARCEYKMLMEEGKCFSTTMEDVCTISGGGTPSTKDSSYWQDGDIPWFTPTDLTRNNSFVQIESSKKITTKGLKESSAKLFPPYTIMMTSRATIGYLSISSKAASTNQGFINIIPKDENMRYVLMINLLGRKDELISNANGSTFLEIPKSNFKKMAIEVPSVLAALDTYHLSVHTKCLMIENLSIQNAQLRQARDILLPKLMNGEIEVDEYTPASTVIEMGMYQTMAAEDGIPYTTNKPVNQL